MANRIDPGVAFWIAVLVASAAVAQIFRSLGGRGSGRERRYADRENDPSGETAPSLIRRDTMLSLDRAHAYGAVRVHVASTRCATWKRGRTMSSRRAVTLLAVLVGRMR